MITLRGRTFDYRDTLRKWGASWNHDDKAWRLYDPSAQQRGIIAGWLGVYVTEEAAPLPTTSAVIDNKPSAFSVLLDILAGDDDRPTKFYGDDPTFMGYFKSKKPGAFFGFSSLDTMIDYIKALPAEVRTDGRRNAGWLNRSDFAGSDDMEHAIELARNGLPDEMEHVADIIEQISVTHATRKHRKFSTVGGNVSVGRMLSGNPTHMVRRPRLEGRQNVTLFVDATLPNKIVKHYAIVKTIAVTAMVDIIEREGYSCEVISLSMTRPPGPQIAVKLKNHGEKLNINDMIFALGHPSFERRLCFACTSSASECERIWQTMGLPDIAFDRSNPTQANEFYIKPLTHEIQCAIRGRTIVDQALSLIPMIEPVNLPVRIIDDNRND